MPKCALGRQGYYITHLLHWRRFQRPLICSGAPRRDTGPRWVVDVGRRLPLLGEKAALLFGGCRDSNR